MPRTHNLVDNFYDPNNKNYLFYGSFVRVSDESFILYYQLPLDLWERNTSQH